MAAALHIHLAQTLLATIVMQQENVPPQFQEPRLPLFEELPLPLELPDAAGEMPALEPPPPRAPDPFLRRT
jgi:hypothetical protein